MRNPYLCLQIDEPLIRPIERYLEKKLRALDIEFGRPKYEKHVTIGQVIGEVDERAMVEMAREFAETPIAVRIVGIKALPGLNTPYNYITLSVQFDGELAYASEELKRNFKVQTFGGKSDKKHITLFTLPKRGETIEDLSLITRTLEIEMQGLSYAKLIPGKFIKIAPEGQSEKLLKVA